jgi:hypothetical protein
MSAYPEDLPREALCYVDGGHRWDGGVCVNCGERLRCGMCGCFVTIEGLDRHLNEAHPEPGVPNE